MDTSSKIGIAINIICKDERATIVNLVQMCCDNFQEVVVNDTGSTDGTLESLRFLMPTFDNLLVIQNEWKKDFALSRNQCKEFTSAKCSHIMFLDADEMLDPDTLQQMRTDEFKRIISQPCFIKVKLRNIELDGTEIDVFDQLRIFPNLPEMYWEGAIHEHVFPQDAHERHLAPSIVVTHTGYRTNDPAFIAAKRKRNIDLLLQQPDSDYKHFTLGNEYFADRVPEALIEYTKSMALCDDEDLIHQLRYVIGMCYEKLGKHSIAAGWYSITGKRDALARLASYYLYHHPIPTLPDNHSEKIDTLTQELGIEYCESFIRALKIELSDPYGSQTTMLEKFCRDELTKRVFHENR